MDTTETYTLDNKRIICSLCFYIMARKPRSITKFIERKNNKCPKCGGHFSGILQIVGNMLIVNTNVKE